MAVTPLLAAKGHCLRSAQTALSVGPGAQPCPNVRLRPGRAGEGRDMQQEAIVAQTSRTKAQCKALSPWVPPAKLGALRSGPHGGARSLVQLSRAACCPGGPSSRLPTSAAYGWGAAAAGAGCGRT